MFIKKAGFKSQWQRKHWLILSLISLVAILSISLPGNTKEKKSSNNNRLPPAPNTGSPEEDFSAGGTRENRHRNSLCGVDRGKIAYLLGNRNREFTLSAYPTFWFHIPTSMNKVDRIEFEVTELETGKKIYDRVINKTKTGITGINLPQEKQYALSPEVNYAWSLEVDCAGKNQESAIALSGWITRVASQSNLQNQLAAASEGEKHTVYLKHNLLYDALTQLAQRRIAKPNNIQIETAWNQLLSELGWQDLIQQKSAIELSILDVQIGRKNSYSLSK
ncbi:MAG: DUF928 domain-containing protein [Cyanobacteria bacterium P01_G01_bin.19]